MTIEIESIQKASRRVERERSLLSAEQCRFRTFRTAISRATVDDADTPSTTSENLLQTYRETVMNTPDFETAYDETLEESLEAELSPSLAEALLSGAPLTQKRKRDFLVKTDTAIERRERYLEKLDRERKSLETMSAELVEIRAMIEELPECSPRRHPIEQLLDIWDVYDGLQHRCEELLVERQRHIHQASQDLQRNGDQYTLNEYLYHELTTSYPVLSAIAATCELIDAQTGGGSFDRTRPTA